MALNSIQSQELDSGKDVVSFAKTPAALKRWIWGYLADAFAYSKKH
jgi:hypothetical protein